MNRSEFVFVVTLVSSMFVCGYSFGQTPEVRFKNEFRASVDIYLKANGQPSSTRVARDIPTDGITDLVPINGNDRFTIELRFPGRADQIGVSIRIPDEPLKSYALKRPGRTIRLSYVYEQRTRTTEKIVNEEVTELYRCPRCSAWHERRVMVKKRVPVEETYSVGRPTVIYDAGIDE